MTVRSLQQLFDPERIVWVGPVGPMARWVATAEDNLWRGGFEGPITAVRTTGRAPAECRTASPAGLPSAPGAAVVCLPQTDLAVTLDELAGIGCRAAVLIGGTGASALDAGAMRSVSRAAKQLDLRVVGPSRVGVIVPKLGLNTGCVAELPAGGDLAFVTQSDSIATSMLEWASVRRIGFSRLVSLGESPDVELGDILDFLTLDPSTRAILIHLQGVVDARRFMSAARAAARIKPVIVLKSGRQLGLPIPPERRAGIRLHRDQVYDVAFTRAGIVRVGSIEELFDAAANLGAGATRRGHGLRNGRLAMVTNGHAPAELAADTLLAGDGVLVRPTAKIQGEIAWKIGPVASLSSAIDLGLEAGPSSYRAALEVLLAIPEIDAILVIHAPTADVEPAEVAAAVAAGIDRTTPRSAQRPVIGAWLGERSIAAARAAFEPVAVPVFTAPEPAVRAFLHRVQHERRQFLLRQVPSSRPEGLEESPGKAGHVVSTTLKEGRRSLNEAEAMAVLDAYGIMGVPTRLAADLDEAAQAAASLGYPVALKVVSSKLALKSSVGGVALDISNEASLHRRGEEMLARVRVTVPDLKLEGLLVQRMERSLFPIELYVGMELDPTFGPILLIGHAAFSSARGLAYLLPPLDSTLAQAMLHETGVGRFLSRQPEGPALIERVVELLVRLSQLVVDMPAVRRIAIDPLLVTKDRLVVLDAHVDLAPVPPGMDPGSRLAIRPYPRELEQVATIRDGREIRLRPVRPEDTPALKRLFDSLTPEDRRLRLFSSMREIPDELAARLTQIDYDREMVLVALDPDDPAELWGGARVAADADNRRAEYSVTIRSDKQGLGLGRICLERVLEYARSRGIEEVWGSVLAENDSMLGLAERLGFTRHRDPDAPDIYITTKRLA